MQKGLPPMQTCPAAHLKPLLENFTGDANAGAKHRSDTTGQTLHLYIGQVRSPSAA